MSYSTGMPSHLHVALCFELFAPIVQEQKASTEVSAGSFQFASARFKQPA